MAIALVTSSNNYDISHDGVSSADVAFGANVTAGDLLILCVGWNDAGGAGEITAISDTRSSPWVYNVPAVSLAGNGLTECIFACVASSSGANTVTVTWSANQPFIDLRVMAFNGITNGTLDQIKSAMGTASPAATGDSPTTTAADEVVVVGMMTDSAFGGSTTTGYTSWLTDPNNDMSGYKIVSSTGVQSANNIMAHTGQWVACLATFKAGGGSPPSLLLPILQGSHW